MKQKLSRQSATEIAGRGDMPGKRPAIFGARAYDTATNCILQSRRHCFLIIFAENASDTTRGLQTDFRLARLLRAFDRHRCWRRLESCFGWNTGFFHRREPSASFRTPGPSRNAHRALLRCWSRPIPLSSVSKTTSFLLDHCDAGVDLCWKLNASTCPLRPCSMMRNAA